MTHGLLALALAAGLAGCGKYGRPSRIAATPGPATAPAEAEACEEEGAAGDAPPAAPDAATPAPAPESQEPTP